MAFHAARTVVQKIGMSVSRRVFTARFLSHPWGKRFYLFLYGSYKSFFDSEDLKKVRPFIRPGSTVVDIGANVGFSTRVFCHAVGPTGWVAAFEPDPMVGDLFRFNLDRAHCQNVRFYSLALGEREADVPFYQNPSNRADNRMVEDPAMAGAQRLTVHMKTLSAVIAEEPDRFHDVSLVKIDVQGYESRVIAGMESWLAHLLKKPVLYLEIWPKGLDACGSSAEDLFHLLERMGYGCGEARAAVQTLRGPDDYTDVIFLPST